MKPSKRLHELRAVLHYWQRRVRADLEKLAQTVERCKEIAAKLREEQNKRVNK